MNKYIWKKGKVHCQARATEIRVRILRVLELKNRLREFRKAMCVFKEEGMKNSKMVSDEKTMKDVCVNILGRERMWLRVHGRKY